MNPVEPIVWGSEWIYTSRSGSEWTLKGYGGDGAVILTDVNTNYNGRFSTNGSYFGGGDDEIRRAGDIISQRLRGGVSLLRTAKVGQSLTRGEAIKMLAECHIGDGDILGEAARKILETNAEADTHIADLEKRIVNQRTEINTRVAAQHFAEDRAIFLDGIMVENMHLRAQLRLAQEREVQLRFVLGDVITNQHDQKDIQAALAFQPQLSKSEMLTQLYDGQTPEEKRESWRARAEQLLKRDNACIKITCGNTVRLVEDIHFPPSDSCGELGCGFVNQGHDDLFDLGFKHEDIVKHGLKITL